MKKKIHIDKRDLFLFIMIILIGTLFSIQIYLNKAPILIIIVVFLMFFTLAMACVI